MEKKARAARCKDVEPMVSCGAGHLTVKDPFSKTPAGQNARVLAYWHAGRKAFEDVEVLGHAQDGSRVGGRSTMLQMVTGPNNQAMWLTPQAPPWVIEATRNLNIFCIFLKYCFPFSKSSFV